MADKPIRITRAPGGEVEAEGPIDAFAASILHRAGFLSQPVLHGTWHRLPFDLGTAWENEHAAFAAEMLIAARYPVALDSTLCPAQPLGPAAPASARHFAAGTPSHQLQPTRAPSARR
ncbi:hypothetical protein DMH18_26315 [Streptomyces sp. WAC 06783]|uniref:hypothetical protein n=1 Tax=Streptomyces sp. WAC 06783 TaxID=2203211 RepID=UPI000F740594|nr:hypothetical protein [Streptomyces sp. WAC 06783]RSO06963.1 hypothetical protein DMH18_26315 [Streptomyces sp. WAC 06783]